MQWLNYHHLYYFKVIATEGSIAKAAEKLRLGQPTLSAQLKQLEDSLGEPLFERRNRGLILTEAGKVALTYSNEVFRLGNELLQVIQDNTTEKRTHLQIGALDSVSKNVTLQLVEKAHAIDKCSVTILEGSGDELLRDLQHHKIDLMVANYPAPLQKQTGVYSKMILKSEIIACASQKWKNLKTNFPESLQGKPFILPTQHSKLRHDLEQYFKSKKIMIDVVTETQDTSIQRLLGENHHGIVPLPMEAAEEMIAQKKLINLGKFEGLFEEIWLISASRKIENPIAKKLFESF